eukprot:GHVH01004412.1.p1 GENE.GHVH01004412.1~~GHVH01004412.1.p1  ORF type:complete len:200 (+),score=26.37 GHVH01004412.1:62-661(+)
MIASILAASFAVAVESDSAPQIHVHTGPEFHLYAMDPLSVLGDLQGFLKQMDAPLNDISVQLHPVPNASMDGQEYPDCDPGVEDCASIGAFHHAGHEPCDPEVEECHHFHPFDMGFDRPGGVESHHHSHDRSVGTGLDEALKADTGVGDFLGRRLTMIKGGMMGGGMMGGYPSMIRYPMPMMTYPMMPMGMYNQGYPMW